MARRAAARHTCAVSSPRRGAGSWANIPSPDAEELAVAAAGLQQERLPALHQKLGGEAAGVLVRDREGALQLLLRLLFQIDVAAEGDLPLVLPLGAGEGEDPGLGPVVDPVVPQLQVLHIALLRPLGKGLEQIFPGKGAAELLPVEGVHGGSAHLDELVEAALLGGLAGVKVLVGYHGVAVLGQIHRNHHGVDLGHDRRQPLSLGCRLPLGRGGDPGRGANQAGWLLPPEQGGETHLHLRPKGGVGDKGTGLCRLPPGGAAVSQRRPESGQRRSLPGGGKGLLKPVVEVEDAPVLPGGNTGK